MKKILAVLLLVFLAIPAVVHANIGVGVGSGKIKIDQKLKPGTIYQIPPFTVLNTGDESSDYEIAVTYNEKQQELKPSQSWFIFSPKSFHLDPGKVQIINIKLNLPISARPGDYYAYLEGHPLKKTLAGETSIGVAAASRFYFTVVPANFFEGIYYKIISFWQIYSPWPARIVIALSIICIVFIFSKFFNVQIDFRKKISEKPEEKGNKKNKK